MCQSLFFFLFIKKETLAQEIFKNTFFVEHLRETASWFLVLKLFLLVISLR